MAKGFTAFLGVNNAGKSALMRFLLEFRPMIAHLAEVNVIQSIIAGQTHRANLLHVLDEQEVFSNLNNNPIEFSIKIIYEGKESSNFYNKNEEDYSFVVSRILNVSAKLFIDGHEAIRQPGVVVGGGAITRIGQSFIAQFRASARILLRSLTVRNLRTRRLSDKIERIFWHYACCGR